MRDIALALFIFGTLPCILMRPYIGLLVWSWLGYMNPHRLCYGFAVSFPWVYLVAVVTAASLLFSKESKKIPWSAVSVPPRVPPVWDSFSGVRTPGGALTPLAPATELLPEPHAESPSVSATSAPPTSATGVNDLTVLIDQLTITPPLFGLRSLG